MITSALTVAISADPQRVWQALTDPGEIVRWDESRTGLIDPSPPYPEGKVRWRSKLGKVTVVLNEESIEVSPPRRLALRCRSGSLRYEQLYQLQPVRPSDEQKHCTNTSLKISSDNRVSLVGAELDRFEVRRLMIGRIDSTLRALQIWCER